MSRGHTASVIKHLETMPHRMHQTHFTYFSHSSHSSGPLVQQEFLGMCQMKPETSPGGWGER